MSVRPIILFLLWCFALSALAAEKAPPQFQAIVAGDSLRVGVALYPPWTMRAKDGELIGSEVDIGRRLATDMGLEPSFALYQFDQLIPALQRGDIDIIIAGLGITPGRALQVNFSRPYGSFGIDLVTNTRLTREFSSIQAMNQPEVKLGVVAGSSAVGVAKRLFPQASVTTFKDETTVVRALLEAQLHGYVENSPVPGFLALRYPDKLDQPLSRPLVTFRQGFAVRQGDPDWLAFLNAWVEAREADNWLVSTGNYWFGSLQWQQLVP